MHFRLTGLRQLRTSLVASCCRLSRPALSHLFAGPGVQASGDHVEPGFFDVSSSLAQGFSLASVVSSEEASPALARGASIG